MNRVAGGERCAGGRGKVRRGETPHSSRVETTTTQRQRQRRRLWLITYIVMYVFMLTQRSTAAAARNALACKMALPRSCVCQLLATTNRGSYQLLLPLLQWHELENSLLLCLSGACLDLLRGCGFLLARLKSQHRVSSSPQQQRVKPSRSCVCVCHGVTHAGNIVQRATCN